MNRLQASLFVVATTVTVTGVGSLATGCSLVVSTSGLSEGPSPPEAAAPDGSTGHGSDDATSSYDSAALDAAAEDSGAPDTRPTDAGPADSNVADASADSASADSAMVDVGPQDSSSGDSGPVGATTDLTPAQDAYVQDTPDADTNFGTSTQLIVKTRSMPGSNRNTWLSFDIAGFTAITAAKLRLYLNSLDTANTNQVPVLLYYPPDTADSWTAATITWNNAPSYGTDLLGTVTVDDPQIGTWIEYDVTGAVAADTNGVATFVLTSTSQTNRGAIFESSRGTASPVLRITGAHP